MMTLPVQKGVMILSYFRFFLRHQRFRTTGGGPTKFPWCRVDDGLVWSNIVIFERMFVLTAFCKCKVVAPVIKGTAAFFCWKNRLQGGHETHRWSFSYPVLSCQFSPFFCFCYNGFLHGFIFSMTEEKSPAY